MYVEMEMNIIAVEGKIIMSKFVMPEVVVDLGFLLGFWLKP